jgi:hypothetical protein
MTLEEYLRKRIEDLQEGPCNSSLVQGKILAFEEILSKLPELEHEVTLREVQEICDKVGDNYGDEESPCQFCPLVNEYGKDCRDIRRLPCEWDIEEIENRVREAQQ